MRRASEREPEFQAQEGAIAPECPNEVDVVPEASEATVSPPGNGLAERLLAIGRDCAAHMSDDYRAIDHGELLYDERGLPR